MRRSLVIAALAAVVAVGGAGAAMLGWRAASSAIHPGTAAYSWSLSDFPALDPESVTVSTRTGVELSGRFFEGRSQATVVLTHGYGGNQDEMLPTAAALHDAGFSVFTYDLRGTGASTGEVTFGAREREDLRSVVDYLVTRRDVDPDRLGALGFSMGGATTLMAAAADPRIRAVVADAAWADVHHWLRPTTQKLLHPNERFSPLSLKLVEWRTGIDFGDLRPGADVARISPRPLLLIAGGRDSVVPPSDGDELYAAAGEPKELWHLADSAHGDSVGPGGATSSARVTKFFERSLRPHVDSNDRPAASA